MMDGTERTPGVHDGEGSVDGRLLDEFTRRLDAVLERRVSDRRLEQKLAEIKRRSNGQNDPAIPSSADPGTAPDVKNLDAAWTTAAGIVATANEVRDEIVHSAATEADEIRTAARKRAEQLVGEAVLEAEEIRAAARKEAAALLVAARRKAEPSGTEVTDHSTDPAPVDQRTPRPLGPPPAPRQRRGGDSIIPVQRAPQRTEAER